MSALSGRQISKSASSTCCPTRGWAEAAEGCRYVLHVASPFVLEKPKDPDELIRPAVEGATRAVKAALDAGAERVVMTSALATMQFARTPKGHVYTDADWTDPDDPRLNAYTVSKIKAERAARELAQQRGAPDRLAVINPGAVIGPLLTDDPGTSVTAIQQIMSGALPMIPTSGSPGSMCGMSPTSTSPRCPPQVPPAAALSSPPTRCRSSRWPE